MGFGMPLRRSLASTRCASGALGMRCSWESQSQGQLRERGKGETVMFGGAVEPEPFLVLLGAIADIRVPAVSGMTNGQPMHQPVPGGLGQNCGGGDGVTAGITIDQSLVGVATFRQRQMSPRWWIRWWRLISVGTV